MSNKPKVIVVLGLKGGVGKSTTCAHVSTLTDGKTAIIETDRQSSIKRWKQSREKSEPLFFDYETFANTGIEKCLARAAEVGCKYVVVDTPPHSHAETAQTIKHADVLVMPTEASLFPLDALKETLAMARVTKKPMVIVLNRVMPRERETGESIEAIKKTGLPLVVIQQRVSYKRALPAGMTVLEYEDDQEAVKEMNELWKAIQGAMNNG